MFLLRVTRRLMEEIPPRLGLNQVHFGPSSLGSQQVRSSGNSRFVPVGQTSATRQSMKLGQENVISRPECLKFEPNTWEPNTSGSLATYQHGCQGADSQSSVTERATGTPPPFASRVAYLAVINGAWHGYAALQNEGLDSQGGRPRTMKSRGRRWVKA